MSRKTCPALIIIIFSLLSFSANAKEWVKAESEHFVVYSNVGNSITRDYTMRLEAYKYLTELLLGANPQGAAAQQKFTVYLLDERELLKLVRPDMGRYVAGVYMHCVEGSVAFAWRPRQFGTDQGDTGLIVLQHEYAHHVMYSHLRQAFPAWYVEGFAEYLSTVDYDNGSFIVGDVFKEREATLTDGSPWVDFRLLVDPKKFTEESAKGQIEVMHFYAQSWLLTHYMLADTKRTQELYKYFDRIDKGEDGVESFESATGIHVDKLENLLTNYWGRLGAIKVKVPAVPENSIVLTTLPKGESDYVLQAAVLQTCPSPDYGKELAGELRAMKDKHANDPEFTMAEADAELLYGDINAARTDLEQLLQKDNSNFEAHYLLGRTYYDSAVKDKSSDPAQMELASREFITAYKLDKLNAANLYFLARSLDALPGGGPPSKSIFNAAVGAATLAPGVGEYAFYAAYVSLRSGNREQAVRSLLPFASDPHNPGQAARVAAMIAAIKSGKSVSEVMNAGNDEKGGQK